VPNAVAMFPCLAVSASGFPLRLRRRRARVVVESMSGGCVRVRRCSTRGEVVQGVLEVARRRVSRARLRVSTRDVLGMAWPPLGARVPAAVELLLDQGLL
jgi:hypothetical protein